MAGPSERKQKAVAAYTKQTGSAPPKSWPIAKIEGRTNTLSTKGIKGTGYTDDRSGKARITLDPVKPQAPAAAFKQKFGHAPPSGMSEGAMQRWTASPVTKAPAPLGAYGPIGSHADISGSGNAHAQPVRPIHSGIAPSSTPLPPAPSFETRLSSIARTAAMPLAVYGTGVQAANAFAKSKEAGGTTGDNLKAGAKAAAPGAAIIAAPAIAKGAGHVATGAFAVARAAFEQIGVVDAVFLNMMSAKIAGAAGIVGVAARGVEIAAHLVPKTALPAVVGVSAVAGAMGDTNRARGAARGAIRGLDPTSIVMSRGLGERAFDKAFGGPVTPPAKPTNGRLSSTQQQQQFAAANKDFTPVSGGEAGAGRRGWSAQARIAASVARGDQNIAYGGDPENGKKGR